ncbi:TIGR03086 family metal-binding protein [Umezawaea sp. Da 62-37]|uniref:TIGR03086 family metal-binding protein n=1 Tax=Umezawaea sp. Da 62-37 TaxID=3075927 RepID=UPI0028F6DA7C|nr:TIGR03086 family metal-binding protein [Umezawaea sp. Da 62-37]WNV91656.1 TIGR03086 family metal-binding protein [Umezawaea sp. Da 62-37]
MLDLLGMDRRACELNVELIEGLTEEELNMATPCVEWTVRELIQHQVDSTLSFTAGARGMAAGEVRPLGGDPLGVYRSTVEEAWSTFDSPGLLDREVEFPGYGPQKGRVLVAAHFVDNLVHAWDLARALGREYEVEANLAEAALRIAEKYPTGIAAFAPPVEVGSDASVTDRLVGQLGRSPRWPA